MAGDFPEVPEDLDLPAAAPATEEQAASSMMEDAVGGVAPPQTTELEMFFDTDDFTSKVNDSMMLQGGITKVIQTVVDDPQAPKMDMGTVLQMYKEITNGTVRMIGAATKLVETINKTRTYMESHAKNASNVPKGKGRTGPKLIPSKPAAVVPEPEPAPAAEQPPASGAVLEQVHEIDQGLSHSMLDGLEEQKGAAIEPQAAPGLDSSLPKAPEEAPLEPGIDPNQT